MSKKEVLPLEFFILFFVFKVFVEVLVLFFPLFFLFFKRYQG
ncbi:MAG: hypothetical protein QXE12_00395 [Conexivisphaerales archaeon]